MLNMIFLRFAFGRVPSPDKPTFVGFSAVCPSRAFFFGVICWRITHRACVQSGGAFPALPGPALWKGSSNSPSAARRSCRAPMPEPSYCFLSPTVCNSSSCLAEKNSAVQGQRGESGNAGACSRSREASRVCEQPWHGDALCMGARRGVGHGGSFAWRSGTHFPCCKQVPTRTGHMQTPGAGVKFARVQFSQAQTLRAARRLHSSCCKQPPPGMCVGGGAHEDAGAHR